MLAILRSVRFKYPSGGFELAVDALDIEPKGRVAIVGPSGCGKSTLLGILAGLHKPDSGQVTVNGMNLCTASAARVRSMRAATLGLVHQDFQLFDALNVMDNILLPFHVDSALELNDVARDRAAALATRAGLAHLLRRSVTRLSQGERQRVAVCRALAAKPSLVLADEPTASLDHRTRDQTIELLFDECARAGAGIVAATHDTELLPRFDRTLALKVDSLGVARIEALAGEAAA